MRKGFTLIELLAVIVILAIIALIATPLIINVIDESKKGAFKNTVYGISKAGELGYTQDVLNGTNEEVTFTYTNGVESSSPSGRTLNYKGAKPQNGTVIVNTEGKVALAIHDGTYCAEKGFNESEVTLTTKAIEECVVSTTSTIVNVDASGASEPELTTGMIPVKWDNTGQNWIKADINNQAGDNQWYDYDAKMWANAVTVTSINRDTYLNAAEGTIIPMTDINTMWVWIPRYSYYITTSGTTTPSEIQIQFESKTDSKSTGDATSAYLTHPAFTFGSDEINGMWIGKFETTGTIDSPTILPLSSSLKNQPIKAMYDSSRSMEDNATYGTSTDANIHMAKDSEWGAVAYLSHSKYGKNSEVWINNSSSFITGCGGDSASATGGGCQNEYYTTIGGNASTTGNIYGIYDMSGGSPEAVMGLYRPLDSTSITDNSGFGATTSDGALPDSKYWDRYGTNNVTNACSGGFCYGHALSETKDWYNDGVNSIVSSYPWSRRGGFYTSGIYAGVFGYNVIDGDAGTGTSFRLTQMKV